MIGNFPQAFRHIDLVNAAWAVADADGRFEGGAGKIVYSAILSSRSSRPGRSGPHLEAPVSSLMIEAEGLTKRYGPTVALGGIDLQVPAGSILGMLGPNGAGKPVTELRHSLLARPAGCRSPGQRSSSRTRPPSWTYCVRERSATRC